MAEGEGVDDRPTEPMRTPPTFEPGRTPLIADDADLDSAEVEIPPSSRVPADLMAMAEGVTRDTLEDMIAAGEEERRLRTELIATGGATEEELDDLKRNIQSAFEDPEFKAQLEADYKHDMAELAEAVLRDDTTDAG